jgi:hypothetical protein
VEFTPNCIIELGKLKSSLKVPGWSFEISAQIFEFSLSIYWYAFNDWQHDVFYIFYLYQSYVNDYGAKVFIRLRKTVGIYF